VQSRNFIPSHRLEAAQRHRRLHAWIGAAAIYAAALVAVYIGCACVWGVDAKALARRRQATANRVEQIRGQIQKAQADLTQARRTLAANEAVGGHPDWSLLLILLAQNMNERVVLRQCRLTPGGVEDDTAAESRPTGAWRLEMSGFGREVTAVSQFALALEKTGLFEEVRLLKTVRQPFMAQQATHFEIQCALGTPPKETP
jgi:hypothetical protein